MNNTVEFYDFCIPYNKDEKLMRETLQEAYRLGYRTVAIEQVYDHSKRDAGKRAADIFPAPHCLEKLQEEFKKQLTILQRLTIIYTDVSVAHAMTNSLNLKKYNFVAGQPKTDAALTHCCTTFGGDIVTFDPDAGAKLLVNRKAYEIAVKRGIYFEIKYAPAIVDSSNRKDMIKLAHNYCVRGKSNNIIFSSGASNAFELRGPYDVANLAYIFGLSEDQGKNAVNKSCRKLYFKAESRRWGKTIMVVKSTGPIVFSDSSESEDDKMDTAGASEKTEAAKENSGDSDSSDDSSKQPTKKKKKTSL